MTTDKTLELPDWLDAHAAVAAGNATPLQHFVSEYQPAAPELAEPFRAALAAALSPPPAAPVVVEAESANEWKSRLILELCSKWSGSQKVDAGDIVEWIVDWPVLARPEQAASPAAASEEVLRDALTKLVECKDLKERLKRLHEMGHGTDYTEYHRLQPLAWEAARKALATPSAASSAEAGTVPTDKPRETLAYSLDEERYEEDFWELLSSLDDNENLVEGATYWVGDVVRHRASDFTEGCAEGILERAREAAFEAADEWAEDFAYPVAQALRDDLERVVGEWADANLPVTFWTVNKVREAEVTADDIAEYRKNDVGAAGETQP